MRNFFQKIKSFFKKIGTKKSNNDLVTGLSPLSSEPRCLTISVKNDTDFIQPVSLFSLFSNQNENVSIRVSEVDYNFLLKNITVDKIHISGMRICLEGGNIADAFLDGIRCRYNTSFGSIFTKPLYPLYFFSQYQMITHQLDIPLFQMEINGKNTIDFNILPKTELSFIFKCEAVQTKEKLPFCMPIIIENLSQEKEEVELFNVRESYQDENGKVKVTAPHSSYNEIISAILSGHHIHFSSFKIYSENRINLLKDIRINDCLHIHTGRYQTINDYQSEIIEVDDRNLSTLDSIKLEIEPNSRIIVMFRIIEQKDQNWRKVEVNN